MNQSYSDTLLQHLPFLESLLDTEEPLPQVAEPEAETDDDSDYEPSDEESDDDYDDGEVVPEDLSHLDPANIISLPQ